eukprot:GHVR01007879.1.p1 GENE.GHVR01007879.1~~GHVR01007879.1.p1  ORF type:complete len:121 (-),score=8.36 GHVR01007879.1:446-808(-)
MKMLEYVLWQVQMTFHLILAVENGIGITKFAYNVHIDIYLIREEECALRFLAIACLMIIMAALNATMDMMFLVEDALIQVQMTLYMILVVEIWIGRVKFVWHVHIDGYLLWNMCVVKFEQ